MNHWLVGAFVICWMCAMPLAAIWQLIEARRKIDGCYEEITRRKRNVTRARGMYPTINAMAIEDESISTG